MSSVRRDADHVPRTDLLDSTALYLHRGQSGGHDQRLAPRVSVPCGPRAGLEGHAGGGRAGWLPAEKSGSTILDLVAGGRVRMLGVGNIVLDSFGNLTIHEDHFDLQPIGH